MSSLQPAFRHVFVLSGGETILCAPNEARRVIDKRHERSEPEPLWEIQMPSGLVRRIWMDEVADWRMEAVT